MGNNSTRQYFIWVKIDWVINGLGKILVYPYFHEKNSTLLKNSTWRKCFCLFLDENVENASFSFIVS